MRASYRSSDFLIRPLGPQERFNVSFMTVGFVFPNKKWFHCTAFTNKYGWLRSVVQNTVQEPVLLLLFLICCLQIAQFCLYKLKNCGNLAWASLLTTLSTTFATFHVSCVTLVTLSILLKCSLSCTLWRWSVSRGLWRALLWRAMDSMDCVSCKAVNLTG